MFKKLDCTVIVCDNCNQEIENMDGFTLHFPAELEGEAEEDAQNADWWVWEGQHWCESCGIPPCTGCGHMFGDHDMGEAPCEDCSCKVFVSIQ